MADNFREGAGTFAAALLCAGGTLVAFVALGAATHEIVHVTVKQGSPDWKAVVSATAAMFLLTGIAALVVVTGRGLGLLPARRRQRRALRARAAREAVRPVSPPK